MVVQTRLLIVTAGNRNYEFRVRVHKAESPQEQLIEPAFYNEFAGEVHAGVHFEMELIKSPVWGRVNLDVPIHIHQNPESKLHFVCFTGNIPTQEAAENVLRMWGVGTVYTMVHNEDFTELARDQGTDLVDFMRDRHGIVISGDMEVT